MNRAEILQAIKREHENLAAALQGIPDDVMTTQPVVGEWTLKDVMGHVAMWRQVGINFVAEYKRDGVPKQLGLADDAAVDAYNKRGFELRRDWSLARVRSEFDESYRDLLAAVESVDDADLSKPLPAPWSKGSTLEKLVAINSYTHDPEHTEQIKKWRAAQGFK